jgi:hypothetical protein
VQVFDPPKKVMAFHLAFDNTAGSGIEIGQGLFGYFS